MEATKSSQAVLEDVAKVQALFPDTPELSELCKRIYTFKTMKVSMTPDVGSLGNLVKSKEAAERTTGILAEGAYAKPIDDLIAYLLLQLRH
jgi:hypothetical protein